MTQRSSRKRLLILSNSDLARDPRVNRQIRYLQERYAVVCAGKAHPGVNDVDYIPIESFGPRSLVSRVSPGRLRTAARLLAHRYERAYWNLPWVQNLLADTRDLAVDGVLANDIDALPVALRIARGAPVILDAHEYAPRQFEDRLVFRMLLQGYRTHLCERYMPQADALMTVCHGIADQYEQDIGVRPQVVWSAPDYEEITPPTGPSVTGVIRLIHHGAASRSRHLEEMIRMFRHLDERFELTFMLVDGTRGYLDKLRRAARGEERIRFVAPVPMREIVRALSEFDLGVYLLPPSNFNQLHALPNKFFEFVQARLGVVVGPSPEMAKLVERHRLGVVATDFSAESMAAALNALTADDIWRFRTNADQVALRYSGNTTKQTLQDVVEAAFE